MDSFHPVKPSGIRKVIWLQWLIVTILNATVIGPLSPFLAFNLIVAVAGWAMLRYLTSGGEYSNYLLFCAFSIVVGSIVGIFESILLRHELKKTDWIVVASTILVFTIEALLSTIASIIFFAGFYGLYPPYCGVGLSLWVLGLAIPLTIPWKFYKTERNQYDERS